MKIDPRLIDHPYRILVDEPTLSNATKASVWDTYHDATDHRDLGNKLVAFDLPPEIHSALVEAKTREVEAAKPTTTVDRTMEALNRLKTLPRNILDLAEKHPDVAAHLVNAATRGEE